MTRSHSLAAAACAALLAAPAAAATFDVTGANVPQCGSFAPADGDVFSIDAGDFRVTAPLSFRNDVFGNPGLSGVGADNSNAIASDVDVVVIQNRDNDDAGGQFPSNWNGSWIARTSLQAIVANTTGDRPGFFVYWNEGLRVNRLFATDNLNDGEGGLELLFKDQSDTLTGVPGAFDLVLNGDGARTDLFPEANANLAELGDYMAANFGFSDQAAAVPVPAALPLFLSGLGALGFLGWRRKHVKA